MEILLSEPESGLAVRLPITGDVSKALDRCWHMSATREAKEQFLQEVSDTLISALRLVLAYRHPSGQSWALQLDHFGNVLLPLPNGGMELLGWAEYPDPQLNHIQPRGGEEGCDPSAGSKKHG